MLPSIHHGFAPVSAWLPSLGLPGLRQETLCGSAGVEASRGQAVRVPFVTPWA